MTPLNILVYILVFIFIIIIIIVYTDDVPIVPFIKNDKPVKCCILLTSYIKNREEMYYNIVNRWLNESNFDIYLVDSSNQGINIIHPKLHQFKFEQSDNFVTSNPSFYEINSILKASQYFDFKNYDMVIKITGKYFIPQLEACIDYLPNADIIFQNRTDTHGQNTEIVCIKSKLLNKYTKNITFEEYMYNIRNRYKCYRFHMFKLDAYVKRSDGSILYRL